MATSEEEQIEVLKKWWDENGRSLLIGLAVVLASVFGWRTYSDHKQQSSEAASAAYQSMLDVFEDDPDKSLEQGRVLVSDYPNSGYATMASLAMAKVTLEKGDVDAAITHLQWSVDNAPDDELREVARLRLARLYIHKGEADAALALLDGLDAGGFRAMFDEVRGDAYLSQNRRKEAWQAYTDALNGYVGVGAKRQSVQTKLDDLADVGDLP